MTGADTSSSKASAHGLTSGTIVPTQATRTSDPYLSGTKDSQQTVLQTQNPTARLQPPPHTISSKVGSGWQSHEADGSGSQVLNQLPMEEWLLQIQSMDSQDSEGAGTKPPRDTGARHQQAHLRTPITAHLNRSSSRLRAESKTPGCDVVSGMWTRPQEVAATHSSQFQADHEPESDEAGDVMRYILNTL
jgi:hypothetical protein